MWPDPQQTADLITFTEEILNWEIHFLCVGSLFSTPPSKEVKLTTKYLKFSMGNLNGKSKYEDNSHNETFWSYCWLVMYNLLLFQMFLYLPHNTNFSVSSI